MKDRPLDSETPLNYRNEQLLMALARIYTAQGKLTEAFKLLVRLAQVVEATGRNSRLIEIWNLSALVLYKQGSISKAVDYIKKSLLLAEPEGFRQIFLDEGDPMIQLLERLQESDLPPQAKAYVNRLLMSPTPS